MPTDRESSLAELVVAQPRAAAVFERLRLDYCCGGASTLADACARRGLDPETVVALLDALPDARHRTLDLLNGDVPIADAVDALR